MTKWRSHRRAVHARSIRDGEPGNGPIVDSRPRLRLMALGFGVLTAVVAARIVALEVSYGAAFREEATRHLVKRQSIPGIRGRILARDGTVLAYDKHSAALAMHYRYFEQPANPFWLRREARARLPRSARSSAAEVAAEETRVLADRDELARRVAALCGVTIAELNARAADTQAHVRAISEQVNRRQQQAVDVDANRASAADDSASAGRFEQLSGRIGKLLFPPQMPRPPAPVVVAEELDYHVLLDDVSLEAVAAIESQPLLYPGVRVVERSRRMYPAATLAAHVLGHLGAPNQHGDRPHLDVEVSAAESRSTSVGAAARVGRIGVERQYEATLRATEGRDVIRTDRGGRMLSTQREREPGVGRDLVLTLDLALQRTAESLLDTAMADAGPPADVPTDSTESQSSVRASGGAIVVMDVHSGALLAAAAAPRFDPNVFVRPNDDQLAESLVDPRQPLFDRVTRMAIPPGSLFKIVTAAALLESDTVQPHTPFFCQGYSSQPDRQRCQIYRRFGLGHGETNLQDALVRSCNVYFFHYAEKLGPAPLVDWARRFGIGRRTGVDLPGESAGRLPSPTAAHAWQTDDTQALAIGQSSLEMTPLQVARVMAAVANGGRLVTPHVASELGLEPSAGLLDEPVGTDASSAVDLPPIEPPEPIQGLSSTTLRMLRESLARVVADPDGTAHATVYLESVPIAGKTGTAETGGNRDDHAWFAGYAPADSPRVALVVVLTHAGSGAEAAGPIARQLVLYMQSLGYFGSLSTNRKKEEDVSRRGAEHAEESSFVQSVDDAEDAVLKQQGTKVDE